MNPACVRPGLPSFSPETAGVGRSLAEFCLPAGMCTSNISPVIRIEDIYIYISIYGWIYARARTHKPIHKNTLARSLAYSLAHRKTRGGIMIFQLEVASPNSSPCKARFVVVVWFLVPWFAGPDLKEDLARSCGVAVFHGSSQDPLEDLVPFTEAFWELPYFVAVWPR